MYDYKADVISTRTGNLGSSDAKLIAQCAELGQVPQSVVKRLAVVKGFIENPTFTNRAMQFGDYVENTVYESLKKDDERWQSNPCLVSTKYAGRNVGVIDHVDFMLQDDEKKVLTVVECKATRLTFQQTRDEYKMQLSHHFLLGSELAESLGDYKLVLMLSHYQTSGLDLDKDFEFDPERLTVKTLRGMDKLAQSYRLSEGIEVIDKFLDTFDYYTEEDEIDSAYLPEKVKKEFDDMTTILAEIKERESKVDEFKERLYRFMSEKNIKGIRADGWSITRVDPSESKTFDYKTFLEDLIKEHPRKADKLRKKYTKTTKKKGFVTIKLKTNKD